MEKIILHGLDLLHCYLNAIIVIVTVAVIVSIVSILTLYFTMGLFITSFYRPSFEKRDIKKIILSQALLCVQYHSLISSIFYVIHHYLYQQLLPTLLLKSTTKHFS